ncbi:MAG: hypothetical protein GYB31_19855 [Bacteroidetes bacterium]|nr:hypothetical protein [Bacteroidota bacterium]
MQSKRLILLTATALIWCCTLTPASGAVLIQESTNSTQVSTSAAVEKPATSTKLFRKQKRQNRIDRFWERKIEGLSLVSFCLGVGALIIMPPHFLAAVVIGLIGILFGIFGFRRINRNREDYFGTIFAIGGILLSAIPLVILILLLIAFA